MQPKAVHINKTTFTHSLGNHNLLPLTAPISPIGDTNDRIAYTEVGRLMKMRHFDNSPRMIMFLLHKKESNAIARMKVIILFSPR